MRFGRLLTACVALAVLMGLPMCGSEDSKKRVSAAGGEGGAESVAGTSSSGGAQNPTPLGGAGGAPDEMPGGASGQLGGTGGSSVIPAGGESNGGQPSAGGETAAAGAAGAPDDAGVGGTPPFCAVDTSSCCEPGEPSCDNWPGSCGQDMNSYSCCDAGQRQTCSVEYFDSNYHVLFGQQECVCSEGACACDCVKGDACPYQEADCNSTSWHDSCVQGNSPTCCDSSTGVRQKCVYNNGKTFTSSVVIDACTGEGFGSGFCGGCLNVQDPPCDQAFLDSCSDAVTHCSDATIGYRLSCQGGTTNVVCNCDPADPGSG